jgi:DNA-binding transcriptional LysR family regulator
VIHRLAPALLRGYREGHPDVEISVGEGNAASLSEAVGAGQLDVAFIRRPVSERSGLAYLAIAHEPLLIALPMEHPAAVKARRAGHRRVKLRELAGDAFILVRRPGAPGMYGDLVEACQAVGFAPRVAAEVGQMLTNVTLVAAGVGVSAVPASMRVVHPKDVFYATASDAPQLSAPLNVVTRIGSDNPTVARFVAFAKGMGAKARRESR